MLLAPWPLWTFRSRSLFKVNHTTSREACGILVGSGPVWSSTDAIILTMSGGHPRSTTLTVEYRGGTFMMWGCFHHQFTPIALRWHLGFSFRDSMMAMEAERDNNDPKVQGGNYNLLIDCLIEWKPKTVFVQTSVTFCAITTIITTGGSLHYT